MSSPVNPASWSALSPRYSPFSRHAGWPSAFMRPMMHLIEIQAWPNQSAPGNAGIEPRLTIGYLTPGVPEPERWPSQTDQESRHMKATGHRYVGCGFDVVGFPPRPDDNDHRCGTGWVLASSVFLAARSPSLGGQPVGPANGRQPALRVALRARPVAGSRR